jgi:hypothetical protein
LFTFVANRKDYGFVITWKNSNAFDPSVRSILDNQPHVLKVNWVP